MQLPEPSADALIASHALEKLIREEIHAQGGWISFARYMQLALYSSQLGYYAGGSIKLGKEGDFTTAPEITPLFAGSLARFSESLFPNTPLRLLEFGAGSGRLAHDLLRALERAGVQVESYSIVEVSAELRARQQLLLTGRPEVQWFDCPPVSFSGLIIANEVLDAMPVPLVTRVAGQWCERGVVWEGSRFGFADRPCASTLLEQVQQQIPEPEHYPDLYLTEVHPQQCAFIRLLAAILRAGEGGAALLIDYGFPAAEYYHPQRAQGSLMCHYRHHAHGDPFLWPGLQDLTAHVDFTAMARMGLESGLELGLYASQAEFLLAAGITQLMQATPPDDVVAWLPQANAVQRLTSPAEMGELFKVLVLSHDVGMPEKMLKIDRSYRL
jgi:SAM-dependent MidA family methyltransferase